LGRLFDDVPHAESASHLSLLCLVPGARHFRSHGRAVGDAVQPVAHQVAGYDGAGPANQDEESRLKRVFGVVQVAQHAPANAQDHRPVPSDEGREGRFIAAGKESAQQFAVRQSTTIVHQGGAVQVLENPALETCGHAKAPQRWAILCFSIHWKDEGKSIHCFLV
jgi:hypothetical protein